VYRITEYHVVVKTTATKVDFPNNPRLTCRLGQICRVRLVLTYSYCKLHLES